MATTNNSENNPNDVEKEIPGYRKYVHNFLNQLTSKSVITVIITAIAGPLAVSWGNSEIKDKELQVTIIKDVLKYTGAENFGDPNSLNKIKIIAKMIEENNPIFHLNFSKSYETLEEMLQIVERGTVKTLKSEVTHTKKQLKTLHEEKENAERQKGTIENDLIKLRAKLNKLDKEDSEEKKQLKEKIKNTEKKISEHEINLELVKEKQKRFKLQLQSSEFRLIQAKEEITKLNKEKNIAQKSLSSYRDKFTKNKIKNNELKISLQDATQKLETSLNNINILQKQIKDLEAKLVNSKKINKISTPTKPKDK